LRCCSFASAAHDAVVAVVDDVDDGEVAALDAVAADVFAVIAAAFFLSLMFH